MKETSKKGIQLDLHMKNRYGIEFGRIGVTKDNKILDRYYITIGDEFCLLMWLWFNRKRSWENYASIIKEIILDFHEEKTLNYYKDMRLEEFFEISSFQRNHQSIQNWNFIIREYIENNFIKDEWIEYISDRKYFGTTNGFCEKFKTGSILKLGMNKLRVVVHAEDVLERLCETVHLWMNDFTEDHESMNVDEEELIMKVEKRLGGGKPLLQQLKF